jgi:hypothetical protein
MANSDVADAMNASITAIAKLITSNLIALSAQERSWDYQSAHMRGSVASATSQCCARSSKAA